MQTMMHYMKLLVILMTITLFSNHLYGVDIKLDGNITKINGDHNNSTCNKDDIYRLTNATTYGGEPFDLLLSIVEKRNDYNGEYAENCIELDEQETDTGVKVYVINAYLRHHSTGPNEPEDNLSASMELEFIAIDKNKPNSEINKDVIHNEGFGLDLGQLSLTAFDLDSAQAPDSDGRYPTLTDDLYVRSPSLVDIGESNLSAPPEEHGFYKLGGLPRWNCQDSIGNLDSDCRGYAKLKLNGFSHSFKFRIQNDNAFGFPKAHDNDNRLFSIALDGALILGKDRGDAPLSYGDAYHEINETLVLGSIVADEEEFTFSPHADKDDENYTDENNKTHYDDEEAVAIIGKDDFTVTAGYDYNFSVTTKGHGYLSAWLDKNKDGSFSEDEKIISEYEVNSTDTVQNTIVTQVPSDAQAGSSFLRVRLSEHNGTGPTGSGGKGEVEDYQVTVGASGSVNGHVYHDTDGSGSQNGDEGDLANVKVQITANGEEQTTTTDNEGIFRFSGVAVGDSNVTIIKEGRLAEPGTRQTEGTLSTIVTVVKNNDTFEENNGFRFANDFTADLVTTKTVDNPAPVEYERFTYTLSVHNNGESDAHNVTLTDRLPEGVRWISDNSNYSYNPSRGLWSIGELANGDTKVLDITVEVEPLQGSDIQNGKSITNTSTAASDPALQDPTTEGDTLSVTITVPPSPRVSISNATAVEGNPLAFDITLSTKNIRQSFAIVELINGSAKLGDDYRALNTQYVNFAPNQTHATVAIETIDDSIKEPTENMTIKINYHGNPGNMSEDNATGTILDNEPNATVDSITDANVTEGENLVHEVNVTLSSTPETYDFHLTNVTTDANDTDTPIFSEGVVLTGNQITVPAGKSTFTVTLPTVDDNVYEGTETYTIRVGTQNATGTINDDDNAIVNSITHAEVTEGDPLVHIVEVVEARSDQNYTMNITNITIADNDIGTPTYSNGVTFANGQLTVPAGVTDFNMTIPTVDDNVYEETESYTLNIGTQHATGTINDDDNAIVKSITDAEVTEGAPLVHTVEVVASSRDQSYAMHITNITIEDNDIDTPTYSNGVTFANGQLTVPAGVTDFNITIPTVDDNVSEDTERYTISVGDQNATGTITDNETPPVVTIRPSNGDAGVEEGNPLIFDIDLSGASDENVTIELATADIPGQAVAGEDYNATSETITIEAGDTHASFTVPTIDDSRVELTETMKVEGVVTGRVSQTDIEGTGTILDNDHTHVQSVGNDAQPEGEMLTHPVEVTLSDSNESYLFAIENISTQNVDYTLSGFTEGVVLEGDHLIVPAGVTTFAISIQSHQDNTYEGTEQYMVHVGDANGTGDIIDSEEPVLTIDMQNGDDGVEEGEILVFDINLSRPSTEATVIDLHTTDGSATAPGDYTAKAETVTIPAGETHVEFNVTTIDDTVIDSALNETMTVHAEVTEGSVGNTDGRAEGTGIIIDNDLSGVQSVSDANGIEGQDLNHTITISSSELAQVFSVEVTPGSADLDEDYSLPPTFSYLDEENNTIPLEDYDENNHTIHIPAGINSFVATIHTLEDDVFDPEESYTITVSDTNTSMHATGTIRDTTEPEVEALGNSDRYEGDNLEHSVRLSVPSSISKRYAFSIENNTTSDNDYDHTPTFSTLDGSDVDVSYDSTTNEVVVGAGVTEFYILVHALQDNDKNEPTERYEIHLGDKSAIGLIYNKPQ